MDPAGGSAPDPHYRLALRPPLAMNPHFSENFTPTRAQLADVTLLGVDDLHVVRTCCACVPGNLLHFVGLSVGWDWKVMAVGARKTNARSMLWPALSPLHAVGR